MLPRLMSRRPSKRALLPLAAVLALGLSACEKDIELAQDDPMYSAAVSFQQKCAGCHTLDAAGAEGSAVKANSREYKDGPNFNVRAEDPASVLYAIRNGGFSSGPMPQNLAVGREAELLACFVAEYSGRATSPQRGADQADEQAPSPLEPPEGVTGETSIPGAPDCPE